MMKQGSSSPSNRKRDIDILPTSPKSIKNSPRGTSPRLLPSSAGKSPTARKNPILPKKIPKDLSIEIEETPVDELVFEPNKNVISSPKIIDRSLFLSTIAEKHRQVVELEFLAPEQTEHREPANIIKERLTQAETIRMSKDPLYSVQLLAKWGYIATELEAHLRHHFPVKGSLLTLDEQIYFLNEIQVKAINYFIDTISDFKSYYCYGCIAGLGVNISNIVNDLYQLKIARLQTNGDIHELLLYKKAPPPLYKE
jgi:hypothetical protein